MKAARRESNLQAIMEATKSKRYPMSRIRRLFLCAYLGITAEDLQNWAPYVRILTAGERGFSLIRNAKKAGVLTLINPGEMPQEQRYYQMEIRASDLYTLFAAPDFEMTCGTEQAARMDVKNKMKYFEKSTCKL